MALTQQQDESLTRLSKQLVMLYRGVKGDVICSEKLSKRTAISAPAVNELRNAFDHNMRADAVWRHGASVPDGVESDAFRYCEKNIEKAIGHVYRAGYDAFDIISLDKIQRIKRYLDDFRITTLHTVIDDYTGKIRKPFRAAIESCNNAKLGKDIEPREIQKHPQFYRPLTYLRSRLSSAATPSASLPASWPQTLLLRPSDIPQSLPQDRISSAIDVSGLHLYPGWSRFVKNGETPYR